VKATRHLFTSESVSMGHPDKLADQISDAVLDAYIAKDKNARVACETLVTTGMALVAGEITSTTNPNIPEVVRETIKDVGYTDASMGFDYETCAVLTSFKRQSPDISQGVTEGKGLHKEQGAGDQGIMFGYACRETPELMPLPIMTAHKLLLKLVELRRSGKLPYLRPDGKSQVTVEYEGDVPKRIHTVVISHQHAEDVKYATIKKDMIEKVIKKIVPSKLLDAKTIYHINPTGRFVVGGPHGDCGLTGRKVIVDTYGGSGRAGGGCFSGKDPSKVDRSAAYAARYIAKNLVAAGVADRLEVQLSYAIGVAKPLSIWVETFGTGKVPMHKIVDIIEAYFPLKPKEIIQHLKLLRPIYRETAANGHFGRDLDIFTWEKTDMVAKIKKCIRA